LISLLQLDGVESPIERGGVVYVCGDASTMAPPVEQAVLAICRDKQGCSEDAAKAWLAKLKSAARYLVDMWPKG
jgi:cytochrome P450/NADPH-cytochrome P450 reductase